MKIGIRIGARPSAGALTALLLMSCSNAAPIGPEQTYESTEACLADVWLSNTSCTECLSALATPECDAPDCRRYYARVLRADGTRFDVEAYGSESLGTVSVIGDCRGVSFGFWSVNEVDEVAICYDEGESCLEYPANCTAEDHGRVLTPWPRATAAEAEFFLGLSEATSCAALPHW